ncbi:MAG: C4-type zinc ribbon domain-containing protein [Phycisphaerae bacterium]|nr:C4-type zinc ribbon domain-containing protein [Phycisphaerae bacterium]MDD5380222.1 C4-type zinc ribbon domain-containing protein [Phycisphaerae bacterium]
MGPILNALIKLQSVENQLRAAKAKLARCRRNVIIAENQVRSLQNAYEAKKEEVQLTKVQSDRLELELKTREEEVAKLRAHLNAAKTNKEYAAVLTQLNTTKADNSKIEAQVLELLKDIEADEAERQNIQNQIDERKQALEQTRKDAEQMAAKYEAEIEEIQAEWDKKMQDIPAEPLQVFNRVAETYDGEALAVVDKQENKTDAYSCGGCFMGITAESVNLLLSKDEIIRCPSCTRILVLSDSHDS